MRYLLILLLLTAYAPAYAQGLIQIRDSADHFSVGVPEDWSFTDEPENEKIQFQAWLPKSEEEPNVQLASITVMANKLPGGKPIDVLPGMLSSFSRQGVTVQDSGKVEIRGREVLWIDLLTKKSAKTGQKHLRYYLQMRDDILYVLMIAGSDDITAETSELYDRILVTFSPGDEMLREKPALQLPASEKWQQLYETEMEDDIESQYLQENDDADNWKTLIHVLTSKDMVLDSIGTLVQAFKTEELKAKVKPAFKVLEQRQSWALFIVERPSTDETGESESSIGYLVQGETSYHSITVSVKNKQLSPEFITKWGAILKKTKLVNE